ncbi:uncharacterized protein N7473_006697 [Penicillium subrubescens]|uniref:uncharacterized protein n=1 Tax=Penicillium subrubescens TaxID=1316194 RepID=UPI00254512F6|nr:uncharacterized protein N7473_006697 [Penicillium subrubescens]KAJ5890469.1 hypothetical protein N7473_006697 [Penicillium subrubescens]
MRPVYTFLPAVAAIGAATPQPSDSWVFGNSMFSLGPPSGNSRIIKATYSILPPSVPLRSTVSNKKDEIWASVWVGASSTAGDHNANLYQPLFNWSPDQESQYVKMKRKNNTEMALTEKISQYRGGQVGQTYVVVPQNTAIDFEIAVVNGKVVQTVTMEGKVISKQSDSCGTIAGYDITNLTGTLSEADTKFANVMKLDNVTESTFMSTDSGITWHTDRITTSRIDFDSSSDTMVN